MAAIWGRWVMDITCRWLSPISSMICAIFSATRPLTPVSISSKMMVGSLTVPLIMALSDSMTRAISPPDATCDTGCKGELVLALKRNATLSTPVADGSRSWKLMEKRTLGMPNGCKRFFISPSTTAAAFWRVSVSWSATCL